MVLAERMGKNRAMPAHTSADTNENGRDCARPF
jgi:hypothetical protein